MIKPLLVAKLQLGQDRLEALHDLLQDTLYQARSAGLPAHILHDLQRATDNAESAFYALANIVHRLQKLTVSPHP